MGKRFTEKAEKALNSSVRIAEEFGHTYVGTEHILLSLLADEQTCASFILKKRLVTYERLYKTIAEYGGLGEKSHLSIGDITPRGRDVLEESYNNSLKYGDGIIGTDHILLSILDEKNSVAIKVLKIMGTEISPLKSELTAFLKNKEKVGKKETLTPVLKQYGKNMTAQAQNQEFDPVIGRDKEIDRLIRILCRKNKNNPCLIGEAGVGKTAIVEGLAQRIANGNVPDFLKSKVIISIDLTSMVAGAKYRGDFEERIKGLLNEVKNNNNVILFIDEIHTIVGAGAAEGAVDAANILKPQLSRGEIQLIGATTFNEYHKYIERDAALERRLQPINVLEPSVNESIEMLMGVKERYEKHHSVKIDNSAIRKSVIISNEFINGRFLPDKALDLLDEACAYVVANNSKTEEKPFNARQTLEKAIFQNTKDSFYTTEYSNDYFDILDSESLPVVTDESVLKIANEVYSIPIDNSDSARYYRVGLHLKNQFLGQDEAIDRIISALNQCKNFSFEQEKPRGIFIFCGKSGVGKASVAKALVEHIFPSEKSFIKLNMSEYSEAHSISKLIGSPPGYVGNENGGMLTERVRRNPNSIILIDAIDKAHKDVRNLFLQIFKEGSICDSDGKEVSFKNTYVILLVDINNAQGGIGFSNDKKALKVKEYLVSRLSEELVSSVDEIIQFSSLSIENVKHIIETKLEEYVLKARENGIDLDFSPDVTDYILANCEFEKGVRSIKRTVDLNISPLIKTISENEDFDSVVVEVVDDELILEKTKNKNARESSDVYMG